MLRLSSTSTEADLIQTRPIITAPRSGRSRDNRLRGFVLVRLPRRNEACSG
jgi:hypothetical protein